MPKFVADSSVSPTGLKWAVDPVADVVTTAGDLIYGTAADTVARLGIGTASQVLAVNSGATAPEWVTPASGALTKITSSTFTAVATASVDSCFSATYDNYRILVEVKTSASAQDIRFRWRVGGVDATGANYDYGYIFFNSASGPTNLSKNNETFNTIVYGDPSNTGYVVLDVRQPFSASFQTGYQALSLSAETIVSCNVTGGIHQNAASYDGFTIYPQTSGTITGKVTVYGYQI